MAQVVIPNPVLNSPFDEPDRHFYFDEDGITDQVVESRRLSSYFVPVPQPKKKGAQLALDNEWTQERVKENKFINEVRTTVAKWRFGGHSGVTTTTRQLLEYWANPDRERRLFFCQIEALETAIYLTEIADRQDGAWILRQLKEANQAHSPLLNRVAFKMATGSGKTVVMAMLIAWHTLNKLAAPQDARFGDAFLIVTPVVFDYIAGWEKKLPDGSVGLVPGKLGLFSNVADGLWSARPNTVLVDSSQLECGEAMSDDFRKIAAREIEEFKAEYRVRFPGRDPDKLTDEDVLREVMNTVGKPGKLGEQVRCVVSVSMLTEGWDANTVTHILGVRAFGTQLLCEQVVGRGLRRSRFPCGCFSFGWSIWSMSSGVRRSERRLSRLLGPETLDVDDGLFCTAVPYTCVSISRHAASRGVKRTTKRA